MKNVQPLLRAASAALLLVACGGDEEAPPAVEGAPATTEAPAEPAPAAFEYTETPTVEMIPAAPVAMMANGRPLEVKSIFFQPRFDNWSMQITTGELDRPTAIPPSGAETAHLTRLPQEMAVGTYTQTMDESGGGFFQIQQPDDAERTTSWNTRMAYALQITEWNVNDYDPEGGLFQEGGTASGKVVITYRGNGDRFQNSWVVGTFEDAVVRYMGKPRWLEEDDAEE